jgi:hypothetical protein
MRRVAFAILSLVATAFAGDQDILTVLAEQSGITTFTQLLSPFTDLVNQLNQGPFTGMPYFMSSAR